MRLFAFFALTFTLAGSVAAQQSSYPSRPIRIVVSSATGGLIVEVAQSITMRTRVRVETPEEF